MLLTLRALLYLSSHSLMSSAYTRFQLKSINPSRLSTFVTSSASFLPTFKSLETKEILFLEHSDAIIIPSLQSYSSNAT